MRYLLTSVLYGAFAREHYLRGSRENSRERTNFEIRVLLPQHSARVHIIDTESENPSLNLLGHVPSGPTSRRVGLVRPDPDWSFMDLILGLSKGVVECSVLAGRGTLKRELVVSSVGSSWFEGNGVGRYCV